MTERDEVDDKEQLAKRIGEQVSGEILCPREYVEGQTLSTYGDFEDRLFCPHRDLDVQITVSNL